MNFYNRRKVDVLTAEEMVAKYGTNEPIPQLGIVSADQALRVLQTELKTINEKTSDWR